MTKMTPWSMVSTTFAIVVGSVCLHAQPTPPIQGNWTLTFEEEFDGSGLDGDVWKTGQHYPGIAGSGSNDPEQITIEDGVLKITAAQKSDSFSGTSYSYAAGEISTFKRFKQKYGYFECRMRYHAVQGMWPAFWLMPDHEDYGWDGKNRESYLKFDLSSVSGPASSAVLKLTPASIESGGPSANVLVLKCADDSWTETGITWNNKPTPDPLFIEQLYGSSELSVGTATSIDVTEYINEELAGDGTVSFALVDSYMRNKLVQFASREHGTTSYRPQLVIDGQTINASADSFVRMSQATTNFGTQNTLMVAEAYGSNDTASTYGTGNEVDIMESLGRWGPDRTQHAVHWDGYGSNHQSVDSGHLAYPSEGDDYHTYGLYWESGKYEFYIDGVKTYEWSNTEVMSSEAFMILSLQLGGWDGGPIDDIDGRSLEVDYVRAWSGTKTGGATAGGGEGPAPSYTTVNVSDDAFVRDGSYAGDNYGSASNLASKTTGSAGFTRQTFLKFDVSGLDPNAERIELVLDPTQSPSPRDTRIYLKECTNDSWSEGSITWNNKPSFSDVVNSRAFRTTDLDFVIDVTNYVRDEINGDGTVTIVVQSDGDSAYSQFHSKESTGGDGPILRATSASGSYLTFDVADMSSYGSGQDAGSGSVGNGGQSITISGNVWKKFPMNYTVTTDTLLRVTVDSSDVGEVIGIGLDENNDHADNARLVQLGGSQSWANAYQIDPSMEYTAGSGPVDYEIELGSVYTGAMSYLILVGDDDADGSTDVTFSNIELLEEASPASNTLVIEAESASGQSAFSPFQVVNGYIVVPQGTGNVNSSSVTESDGIASYDFVLSDAANVTISVYTDFPSGGDDSYWHKMDGGSWVQQNYDQSSPITHTYNSVSAGSHTFSIARREDGSAIDRFVITVSSGTISQ